MVVRRLLVAAVLPALFLASCGGEDPPPTRSSTSVSPTPSSTSASVDPLAIPAEAREPTKAGAEMLIRHFWAMVNHLRETGDSSPIRRLYAPGCEFCRSGVEFYESTLAHGGSFHGGEETVLAVRAHMRRSKTGPASAYANVRTTATPQVQRDQGGKVVNEFPGGETRKGYSLVFQDGHWEVLNVEDLR